jgi:outer membrane receptor protein involved in Fe transport
MKFKSILILSLLLLASHILFAGTTGKIAGRVVDGETGMGLPGANVIIVGTTLGAATDIEGYYTILNLPPDVYSVKATMIGFSDRIVSGVQVKTDLTSRVNLSLTTEVLTSEEIVVVAETPIVIVDLAGSHQTISGKDLETLPVTTVSEAIGLQAGVSNGFQVRGGGQSEVLFRVDGITLRDGRSNQPITDVPLSAVQEISVQKGGFTAEYNNVRSGIVNVVSKEGNTDSYSGTITFKLKPATPKHFGISPYDPDAYWLRPYLDEDVAWTGTNNGAWDKYTQRQYPQWDGWNSFSQRTLNDDDPSNDLTPEAAKRLFEWQYRKQGDITKPDYYLDGGFGGPVPLISKSLGNLRFYASFKREQNQYLMQMSREAFTNQSIMLRLTADLKPSMKLTVLGLYGELLGTSANTTGNTSLLTSTWGVANTINTSSFTVPWRIHSNEYYSPTARYSNTLSAKLTHVLSPETFYEVQLLMVGRKYFTSPGRDRNLSKDNEIFDGYFVDEAPIGFYGESLSSVDGNLALGGALSASRDQSQTTTYSARFDIENQFDRHNQFKAGFELSYEELEMEFGSVNEFLPEGNIKTSFFQKPLKATAYFQDKIEFEGWVSNVGLIAEYSDPNSQWYNVDVYDRSFYSQNYNPDEEDTYLNTDAKGVFTLSPRVSVSHPITETSKLYFNYGHYRQLQTSENLYRIQRGNSNELVRIGDPSLPLAKTVAYELGFDQALLDEYLIRVAAYYKDITDQERFVRYISFDDKVNYRKLTNNSYEDIFGVEVDLTKIYGEWITGNLNFEYRVGTSGFFGFLENYENPALQRDYLEQNPVQSKPRPQPRFKSWIDVHTPIDFGPKLLNQHVLGDWHFTFISRWTAGEWFTWNPQNLSGIEFNAQWKADYNVDLKIAKIFPVTDQLDLKFFADMSNLFNFKHFSNLSFRDAFDRDFYMKSLHLSESDAGDLGYNFIPGDDNPGDVRPVGVDFQPIEWMASQESQSASDASNAAIYYDAATKKYMEPIDGQWQEVSSTRMNKILDDKAYIDMPNQSFFTFLNPRNIFFGITINYKF